MKNKKLKLALLAGVIFLLLSGINIYKDYFANGIITEFIVDYDGDSEEYFYIERIDGKEYLSFMRGRRKLGKGAPYLSEMTGSFEQIYLQSSVELTKDEYRTFLNDIHKLYSSGLCEVPYNYTYSANDNNEYFIKYRGKFYSDNPLYFEKSYNLWRKHPNRVTRFLYDTEQTINSENNKTYHEIFTYAAEILRTRDHKFRYGS
ncbi:MAG: hypothetical protein IJR59_04550 [Firmicutes bacterium]|nr:hypothetical protein [Bacillota bacterium]